MKLLSFLNLSRKQENSFVAISKNNKGIGLVYIQVQHKQPKILALRFSAADSLAHAQGLLKEWVNELRLHGKECSWVLHPQDYRLTLLDALDVPDKELLQAVSWKIKDMQDISLKDATLDVFKIPPHVTHGRVKKMYVVISRTSHLQQIVSMVSGLGLNLSVIDIHELALRNIASYWNTSKNTCALVTFRSNSSDIILTRGLDLYLARRIDLKPNLDITEPLKESLSSQASLTDNILLEIQRSFDYTASQLGLTHPSMVLLAPIANSYPKLPDYLAENLNTSIERIDINSKFKLQTPISYELQDQCLSTLGGALRIFYKKSYGKMHATS